MSNMKNHLNKIMNSELFNDMLDMITAILIQKGIDKGIYGSRIHSSDYIDFLKTINTVI